MTKENWKGAKQRSVLGAYTKEWSGDPTDEKLGGMIMGRDSTRMGPAKYPSMDDLAHEPGPTPNKYVRNVLKPLGLGQGLSRGGDPQDSAGTDDVIKKWHGDGGFSGPRMGDRRMSASNHPSKGSDRRTNVKRGQGTDTAAPKDVPGKYKWR
jgi:hypothetical protein